MYHIHHTFSDFESMIYVIIVNRNKQTNKDSISTKRCAFILNRVESILEDWNIDLVQFVLTRYKLA